jgi:hypothetical protein
MNGISLHNSLPPCGIKFQAIRVHTNARCWNLEISPIVCFDNYNTLKVLGASKGGHQTGKAATIMV